MNAEKQSISTASAAGTACAQQRWWKTRRGQALPLGLVFITACLGSMLFMFSSGKLVDEKIVVTNAADAAAYSAGVAEARALNYEAYVNRAIIANELAIAQALSLSSWYEYFRTAVYNVGGYGGFVSEYFLAPPTGDTPEALRIGGVLGGTAYLNYWSGGSLLEAVQYLHYANAAISDVHVASIVALRGSQVAVDAAMSSGVFQRNLAREVAQRADASLQVEIVPASIADLAGFTRTYGRASSGGDERGRLADLVMRSRDPFTADRSWTLNAANVPLKQRNVSLRKRGGTDLVNYDEWVAMDTLSGHAQRWGCKRGTRWCSSQETVLAYGAVQAGTGAGDRGHHGGAWRDNGDAAQSAESTMVDMTSYGVIWPGLSDTQELANLDRNRDQRVGVSFFVWKPDGSSRSAGRNPNVRPTGQLAVFDSSAPEGRIAALSRAEVFFQRPEPRADGRRELPSLYSPYWQSRLVAATAVDKAYAASRQGGLTLGP